MVAFLLSLITEAEVPVVGAFSFLRFLLAPSSFSFEFSFSFHQRRQEGTKHVPNEVNAMLRFIFMVTCGFAFVASLFFWRQPSLGTLTLRDSECAGLTFVTFPTSRLKRAIILFISTIAKRHDRLQSRWHNGKAHQIYLTCNLQRFNATLPLSYTL